jgi:hypothetical protein
MHSTNHSDETRCCRLVQGESHAAEPAKGSETEREREREREREGRSHSFSLAVLHLIPSKNEKKCFGKRCEASAKARACSKNIFAETFCEASKRHLGNRGGIMRRNRVNEKVCLHAECEGWLRILRPLLSSIADGLC